ncbi:MAG TPA: threonine--tRNA ligase [Candidatus Angelobacter sp.]|nr:threonine--tRNA ligase [Candidatus Angelobacter sp.]
MVAITLPDGSVRRFDGAVAGADIAAAIGPGLAKAALAIKVDGALKDLSLPIERDARIEIVTRTHPAALELLRHDCAHVLAEAVQELYPGTQITFGPATDSGFYYDFVRNEPFSTDDFAKIEAKMREIVDRDEKITRAVWSRDEAARWFADHGEKYKAEWVHEIPDGEEISIYRQGNWLDMCVGPHLPSTGKLGKAFKLMKLAGAYWRGDAKNAQLQRIYGTCWPDEKQLAAYLHQLEEAEKRDHRRIGKEMNLFHQQEEAAGMVFWHPKGWTLWRTLEGFIRDRIAAAGYLEVRTPQLIDKSLFKASGHWDIYGDNMFKVVIDKGEREFGIKPMNCPGHVQIFRQGLKSYRDLPLRFSEFGSCHRNEPSGALHGIMRVRAFTQDDGHIFCTEEQVTPESVRYCELQMRVFRDLGFENVIVKLALRPTPRAGTDDVWDRAEEGLRVALRAAGLAFEELPGEGAFYGPKVEFHLTDAIGRTWQCGTLQLDFVLPERLDASYIGEDGQRHRPVMLHRALLGSMERFVGVLIEHYAGHLPLWLAPLQAVVATITGDADGFAGQVQTALSAAGLRVETDLRNEKINYKVREHSLAKVPIILVVGKKEAAEGTVALRRLGGEKQEVLALTEAVNRLRAEAAVPGA